MTAVVTVQDVEKHFGTRRVLSGVSFAVHDRDRIGLIGANGSGKSTLLKIIVGDLTPDEGDVTWRRDLRLDSVVRRNASQTTR